MTLRQDLELALARRPFAAAAYLTQEEAPRKSDEVAALRGEVKTELRALRAAVAKVSNPQEVASQIHALRELVESLAPAKKDRLSSRVAACGIEGPAARTVARALRERSKTGEHDAHDALREALSDTFRIAAWPLARAERTVIACVGPSGVGKTTTSAKLAAHAVSEGRSVLLVACDTFRVGAAYQLRRYAELMNVDYAATDSSNELDNIIAQTTADVIIVDTAGQAPTSPDGVEHWLARGTTARTRHVLLCLPGAIRASDARRAFSTFAVANPTALCMTKLDETDAPAGIVHSSSVSRLPVSTICFGPRVPEDIAQATSGALLEALAPKTKRSSQP